MINVFEPCSLQVGDRNFYTFLESDLLLSKDQWRRKQKDTFTLLNPDHACLRPKLSPKRFPNKQRSQEVDEDDDDDVNSTAQVTLAGHKVDTDHLSIPNSVTSRKSDNEEWDTEDTGSFSDSASLSSTCSNSSQCKDKVIVNLILLLVHVLLCFLSVFNRHFNLL